MAKKTNTFEQQVVEIQGVTANEGLFVALEDHRKPRHLRVRRVLIKVLRSLLYVLRVADPGKRSPVLHELFIKAERAVDRLDDRNLIVVIVDREPPCEPGTDGRESVA